MKTTVQTLAQLRQYFTENARQVQVEGVADTVAVGYIQNRAGSFAYVVFYGKQSKPAKYYTAKDEAQAEQRIIEALAQAGQVAERKAQDRQQTRQPFTEREHGGIVTRSYTTAGTAQLIREALKMAFPGVKFSVTSDQFANGSSVDIRYTDGPSHDQVKQVYRLFISGSFNSQEDIYEYKPDTTSVTPGGQLLRLSYGAKYISAHRSYSPAYGFFLNSLDLRQAPSLAQQFGAFYKWHSAQRYNMRTSYGQNAGTHSVSSDSAGNDLERFAEALTVQGHTPTLTDTAEGLELTVSEPLADETDRQFYAAELSWLQSYQPGRNRAGQVGG